ncbi:hypothetical protein BDZ91DRAFT_847968 [Kalaharituber pfeilii]|nr:hypothetical protein BDZ91DRAFT_847968 [Kalaharituber pfeilii]
MSYIYRLPTELIDEILNYVIGQSCSGTESDTVWKESTKTFVSLTQVSKHLRWHAEPYLYKHIRQKWRTQSDPPNSCTLPPSPYRLLRTLLNRPDLASQVQKLSVEKLQIPAENERPKVDGIFTDEDWQLIKDLILQCGFSEDDVQGWVSFVAAGFIEMPIALLLALVYNATALNLTIDAGSQPTIMFDFLEQALAKVQPAESQVASPAPGKFLNFKRIVLQYWRPRFDESRECKLRVQDITLFFRFPRLKTMQLSIPCKGELDWEVEIPCAKTLRALYIHGKGKAGLTQLLGSCPNLDTLRYSHVPPLTYYNIESLRKSLLSLQSTLVYLSLSFRRCIVRRFHGNFQPPLTAIGCLQSLTKLITLKIPDHVLVGPSLSQSPPLATLLPRQLKNLYLRDDLYPIFSRRDWRLATRVAEFLQSDEMSGFKLEIVGVQYRKVRVSPEDKRRLETLAASVGVKFIVTAR